MLAWLRALGFEDANSQADAAMQQGQVERRVAFTAPEIRYQGDITQENVSGNFEDRGLFRSGQHEMGLARAEHNTQYQLGNLELGGAESIAAIQSGLAQEMAARRRAQIEQEMALGQSLEVGQARRAAGV